MVAPDQASLPNSPRMTKANAKDHGRIHGKELMDVSRMVMSANMDGDTKVSRDKPKVPEEP